MEKNFEMTMAHQFKINMKTQSISEKKNACVINFVKRYSENPFQHYLVGGMADILAMVKKEYKQQNEIIFSFIS